MTERVVGIACKGAELSHVLAVALSEAERVNVHRWLEFYLPESNRPIGYALTDKGRAMPEGRGRG